jgi:predicted DNA-binding transcriptional regulator AlpA
MGLVRAESSEVTSMSTVVPQLLLDYEQAAKALSLSRAALRDLVYKNRGPVVTRIGRRTLFAVSDLQAFVERHREIPRSLQADSNLPPRRPKRGRPTIAETVAKRAA